MAIGLAPATTQVEKYTRTLCEVIRQDFIREGIQRHKRDHFFAVNAGDDFGAEYHQSCIQDLQDGIIDEHWIYEAGRKYYKIIHICDSQHCQQRSVHAFVDKKTGDVYKPAGWKSPAKYVRFNLIDEISREECYSRCDWAGGYLYL